MPGHDILVVGASAGGVEALMELVRGLPPDLPAALFVVLHLPTHGVSALPQILTRAGSLPALHPLDNTPIEPGHIYIAPPDYHLLVRPGHVRLTRGPRENGHRPAVDTLFRSAARSYDRRVVGVVLTGALDDGTAGLFAVKQCGGVAIVQDPEEAFHAGMPRSAIAHVAVDHILPLKEIAPLLVRLSETSLVEEGIATFSAETTQDIDKEADFAELDLDTMENPVHPGIPSGFGCPECGGALWEIREGEFVRFRCRVGHAWSAETLLAEQSHALEETLWIALRALEERAALSERMAASAAKRGHNLVAQRFEEQVEDTRRRAALLRNLLRRGEPTLHLESEKP